MTADSKRHIETVIKTQIPRDTPFYEYKEGNPETMQIILEKIREKSKEELLFYRVPGNSLAEVFCLNGFDERIIVYNDRYLSLNLLMRQFYFPYAKKNNLPEFSERTFLYLISEMALKYGNPDFAVLAFMKSVTNETVFASCGIDPIFDGHLLETSPKDEMYMAVWFFGILHEVGHFSEHYFSYTPSDDKLIEHIRNFSDQLGFSPSLKQEALKRALEPNSDSVINLNSLKSEGRADCFAFSFLFYELISMSHESGEQFNFFKFIREIYIFYDILSNISACKNIASKASKISLYDSDIEMKLYPIATALRFKIIFPYFSRISAQYIHGPNYTDEKLKETITVLNRFSEILTDYFKDIRLGLNKAFEFSMSKISEKENDNLFEQFKKYYDSINLPNKIMHDSFNINDLNPASWMKVTFFASLASSLGKESANVKKLSEILDFKAIDDEL